MSKYGIAHFCATILIDCLNVELHLLVTIKPI